MTACSALEGLLAVLALLQGFPGASAQPFINFDASIQMSTNASFQGTTEQVFNSSQYLTVRFSEFASCCSFQVVKGLSENMQACACKRPSPQAHIPGVQGTLPVSGASYANVSPALTLQARL